MPPNQGWVPSERPVQPTYEYAATTPPIPSGQYPPPNQYPGPGQGVPPGQPMRPGQQYPNWMGQPFPPGPYGGQPQPYGSYPPYQASGSDGMSIASLVLGLLWMGGLGSLLAVIFGHLALGRSKREHRKASGVTIAGLVLGYVGLVMTVLLILASIAIPVFLNQRSTAAAALLKSDLTTAASSEESYYVAHGRYADDVADLGLVPAAGDQVEVRAADSDSFCLAGASTRLRPAQIVYYSSRTGWSTTPCA
jgi:Tfp pilus assembly protein PilE